MTSKILYISNAMNSKLVDRIRTDNSANEYRTPFDIVTKLAEADPTSQKKHLQWIVRMYVTEQFKMEDIDRIKSDISLFLKNITLIDKKDLNNYESFTEFLEKVTPFQDKAPPISNKEQQRLDKAGSTEYIINNSDFKLISLKTVEAAKLYGKGTKWCTSGDENNMFDTYIKRGPLYIVMVKENDTMRKFQMHVEDGEFKNEIDLNVTENEKELLNTFPQWKTALEYLIGVHYKL